jgi:hypothetical protein
MIPALMLLLLCQDNEYVQKLDKVKYNLAVRSCKEAERKLDSDEASAIDRLTRIIDDGDLSKKECTLFVQQTDVYDPPYAFLPFQYRARARMSLAAKAASPAEKKRQLDEAVRDLEESVKRNVKSSASYLEAAKAELQKLAAASAPTPAAPPPAPPEPPSVTLAALRTKQAQLLAENRFQSARLLADREGAGLPAADRAELVSLAEKACRSYLTEEMRRFRGRVQRVASVADLRAMTKDEFEVTFELPPQAEIAIAHPAYDWARREAGVFADVWANRKPGSALLAAAEEAAHLEEGGENPWFRICEGLAYQDLLGEVERRMTSIADAPKARRDQLNAEVRERLGTWTSFVEHLGARASWVDDHSKALRALIDRQPRDPAELDGEDLRSCFERFPVEPQLQALEDRLRKLDAAGGLTRESRRKIFELLVAARSFRLFLEGKTEPEVCKGVRDDLENLVKLGGAADPDHFGPRIRRVYDSLR